MRPSTYGSRPSRASSRLWSAVVGCGRLWSAVVGYRWGVFLHRKKSPGPQSDEPVPGHWCKHRRPVEQHGNTGANARTLSRQPAEACLLVSRFRGRLCTAFCSRCLRNQKINLAGASTTQHYLVWVPHQEGPPRCQPCPPHEPKRPIRAGCGLSHDFVEHSVLPSAAVIRGYQGR